MLERIVGVAYSEAGQSRANANRAGCLLDDMSELMRQQALAGIGRWRMLPRAKHDIPPHGEGQRTYRCRRLGGT
jgi:hypothetical protein